MIEGYDESAAYRDLPDLVDAPSIPDDAEFSVVGFEWQWSPHPYLLSHAHVEFAAEHFHGELTPEAIRAAEADGCVCTLCAQQKGVSISFDNHRRVVGIVIKPNKVTQPNDINGLKEWLNQNEFQLSTELKVEVLVFAKPERAGHESGSRHKK